MTNRRAYLWPISIVAIGVAIYGLNQLAKLWVPKWGAPTNFGYGAVFLFDVLLTGVGLAAVVATAVANRQDRRGATRD